jgi:hypothetical protein
MSEEIELEDDTSFGWLATMYPHETYATYPERFWEYFQTQCPGVTREDMKRMLKEDKTAEVA